MDDSPASLAYLWQVPAKPVSVRLSLNVVDRLGAAVMEGFKSIPRRGLETGGLLLGRERRNGDGIVVEIDDFEPLECEHAMGPSYLLSSADRRQLEQRIAWRKSRKPAVVGFYRGHTRRDFALTVEDIDLMTAWFSRESNVFLLLHSNGGAPPTAGFAIWEGKKIRSNVPYGKFEFSRSSLMASGAVCASTPPARSPRTAALAALAEAAAKWWSSLTTRVDWGWIAAAAIVIVTLFVAAVHRRDVAQPLASVQRPTPVREPAPVSAPELKPSAFAESSMPGPSGPPIRYQVDSSSQPPDGVGDRDRVMDRTAEKAPARTRRLWIPAPAPPPAPATSAALLPLPETPAPAPPPPSIGDALPAAVKLSERLPVAAPLVSVEVEPAGEPKSGLLGRLVGRRTDRAGFVPPTPVHRPSLVVPPNLRDRARRPSSIDVRVYVDPAGRVQYAELETEASSVDSDLAALAVFSARRWQFAPAHLGDRKVPGEVVLRYRFGTP